MVSVALPPQFEARLSQRLEQSGVLRCNRGFAAAVFF
jgi:hypothetical protein